MFGVSFFELIVIFGVALIVFGPEKLPEIARTLGKVTGELSKHTNALRREFYNSVYTPAEDLRARINTETRELRSVSNISLEHPGAGAKSNSGACTSTTEISSNAEPKEQK